MQPDPNRRPSATGLARLLHTRPARRVLIAMVIAAVIGVAGMIAVFWWPRSEPIAADLAVAPAKQSAPLPAVSMAVTPAQALADGHWPGLPKIQVDDGRRSSIIAGTAGFDKVEPGAVVDPEILDRSLAELMEAFETLPDPQRAGVAFQIGQRLMSCIEYQSMQAEQLKAEARREFQQQQKARETLIAILGPDAAEQSIAELASLNEEQWIANRVAEQQQLRRKCDGAGQMDAWHRMSEAAAWWRRAADLGSLEGLNTWVGMAFFDAPVTSGNAARVAEIKVQVLDAIYVLLARRYAPVLTHLAMFSAQGHFDRPSQSRAWIYGEAFRRIAAKGRASGWRLRPGSLSSEFPDLASELQRIADEMDPETRCDAEA